MGDAGTGGVVARNGGFRVGITGANCRGGPRSWRSRLYVRYSPYLVSRWLYVIVSNLSRARVRGPGLTTGCRDRAARGSSTKPDAGGEWRGGVVL